MMVELHGYKFEADSAEHSDDGKNVTLHFNWNAVPWETRQSLSSHYGVAIYYDISTEKSYLTTPVSDILIDGRHPSGLGCECGKEKHGFGWHLMYCPKWSKN